MIRELSKNEVSALHYELVMKDIIAAAEKLPPFPDVAWKLTAMIKQMAPVSELEKIIGLDPALAATILRLSRSAYYGRRFDVRSLKDAILLLGNQRLLQVVISACALRYFEKGGAGPGERELWEHSVATAIISEIISRKFKKGRVLTLYTASLLHDIGKTILNVYAKIYMQSSIRRMRSEGRCIQVERMALGIDHQELGGIIARNWKFPPEIIAAIAHHHDPESGPFWEIASVVYAADKLADEAVKEKGQTRENPLDPDKDMVFKNLGITSKIAEEIKTEFAGHLAGVKKMLE